MKILSTIRSKLISIYRWAGDSSHRRAIATVLALIVAQVAGKEFDIDNMEMILTVILGAGAAAWSSRTNGLADPESV